MAFSFFFQSGFRISIRGSLGGLKFPRVCASRFRNVYFGTESRRLCLVVIKAFFGFDHNKEVVCVTLRSSIKYVCEVKPARTGRESHALFNENGLGKREFNSRHRD